MCLLANCLEVNGRVAHMYIWNQSHWVNCLEVKSPVGFQDLWVNCPLDQRSGGQASVGLPSVGPISVRRSVAYATDNFIGYTTDQFILY